MQRASNAGGISSMTMCRSYQRPCSISRGRYGNWDSYQNRNGSKKMRPWKRQRFQLLLRPITTVSILVWVGSELYETVSKQSRPF
jgi:hypothetical protein